MKLTASTAPALLALALATLARPAHAALDAEACIAAHADGQEQRSNGALLAARASFAACSAAPCPEVIRSDCAAFASEVETALPSVVIALPASVEPRSLVARVDGAPAALPLDGAPVPLDPGEHRFVFELADGRTDTQTLTLREGEKSRLVEPRFLPPSPAEGASPGVRVPVLSYVFGGAAVLAAGSFTYFGLRGRSDESKLERCAPRCNRSEWSDERDSMRTNYLVADVSLGVAIASLGLGAYFLIDAASSTASAPEGGGTFGVSGAALPGGFRLDAAGSF